MKDSKIERTIKYLETRMQCYFDFFDIKVKVIGLNVERKKMMLILDGYRLHIQIGVLGIHEGVTFEVVSIFEDSNSVNYNKFLVHLKSYPKKVLIRMQGFFDEAVAKCFVKTKGEKK